MTRSRLVVAGWLLALAVTACGRYGPPVRVIPAPPGPAATPAPPPAPEPPLVDPHGDEPATP
jgi:hypothetical protein